tara:strand:- start:1967 stop:2914 length:948 start_codon:yes stop_codon:yes gene_type:complete
MPAEEKMQVQMQSEADAKMVDLPAEGEATEVKLDDEPKKVNADDTSQEVDVGVKEAASESEVEEYGKKVQTRIDKLTKRAREAERREKAAIDYAQGVQRDAQEIKQRAQQVDSGYVAEYGDRVEAQITQAKRELKEAMDLGDTEKQVDAQTKLSRLAIEEERAQSHKAQRERLKKEMEARGVDPNQPQMPQQPQYQPRPAPKPPDPKAEEWANKNEWFGQDEPMTLTSFSIHRKLVEEGFDTTSDSYYNEIDKRMKETFPHRFEKQVSPTQAVSSVNRSAAPGRRKGTVRLTPSQVAISKKLGVPLSEYAKYVKE